jgi:hypothetical protein
VELVGSVFIGKGRRGPWSLGNAHLTVIDKSVALSPVLIAVNYHTSEAQNILGCTAVLLTECRPTFQRYV